MNKCPFSIALIPGNFQEVLNHSHLFSSWITKLLHMLTFCGDWRKLGVCASNTVLLHGNLTKSWRLLGYIELTIASFLQGHLGYTYLCSLKSVLWPGWQWACLRPPRLLNSCSLQSKVTSAMVIRNGPWFVQTNAKDPIPCLSPHTV